MTGQGFNFTIFFFALEISQMFCLLWALHWCSIRWIVGRTFWAWSSFLRALSSSCAAIATYAADGRCKCSKQSLLDSFCAADSSKSHVPYRAVHARTSTSDISSRNKQRTFFLEAWTFERSSWMLLVSKQHIKPKKQKSQHAQPQKSVHTDTTAPLSCQSALDLNIQIKWKRVLGTLNPSQKTAVQPKGDVGFSGCYHLQ